jgi:hypothetical protein
MSGKDSNLTTSPPTESDVIFKTYKDTKFTLIKHALGSFGEQDGYDKANEDKIAYIRMFIVGSNLLCAWLFMLNIVVGWIVSLL